MALSKYNQKRDFKKTAEPEGIVKATKGELHFVVQKHAASHLHYDFRLEIDGVLVSWAVPKGPSANPSDRRLAMHVEDHPMDYMDFEGTIPKGEYGGGTVMVWDIGTYRPEGAEGPVTKDNALMKKQLKERSIKIVINGSKLKGAWHLFEMKDKSDQWLLMKAKDDEAGKHIYDESSVLTGRDFDAIAKGNDVWSSEKGKLSKEEAVASKADETKETEETEGFTAEDVADAKKIKTFPHAWRPQNATLTEEAFDGDDWIFETKYDGYRALAQVVAGKTELISRNGNSFTKKYAAIAESFDGLHNDLIIDGEVVVEDPEGKSHFQWLQLYGDSPKKGKLKFYAFDILYFNGFDLRGLPLMTRKKILEAVLPKSDNIGLSPFTENKGKDAFDAAGKAGGEGIIAKKKNSHYAEGKRTKDWLKIKAISEQEMVIGGFTDPNGSRKGLGALLCGYYDKDKKLIYAGKVGTGFTEGILSELRAQLDKLIRKTTPFKAVPREERHAHWVDPKLVAQLRFSEWTDTGSMRHPVYLGLREDKAAKDVTREMPVALDETKKEVNEDKKVPKKKTGDKIKAVKQGPDGKVTKATEKKTTDKKKATKPDPNEKVTISNPDKVFWPKEKITKGDVIDYYKSISDYILPYLKDRPQSMRRNPNGIKDNGFFQKNVEGTVPDWIETEKVHSDSTNEEITYLLCQNEDTLLYMANLGCIEMNPWSSRIRTLDHPDYIIFDLDPQTVETKKIVQVLFKLKDILDTLKVPAYVKTSGGKGIHVFIPVKPKYTYEETRTFSHIISQMVLREMPEIVSLERMPAKRKNKVYLDFLQNGKGKTMASIYSLRPREGATVSTPLDWDEISEDLDLKDYNIKTVPKRLAEKGDLWKNFFDDAVDLKLVLKNLGG